MNSQKTSVTANPGQRLLAKLGVEIEQDLLIQALTHRSFGFEMETADNERLEFLGDSVLGIVVTEALYKTHPTQPEGKLAKMRSAIVSQRPLAEVAREIGLGGCILLGKGETQQGGNNKDSILSDTVEALIGAIYLTHGLEKTREVVLKLVAKPFVEAGTKGAGLDWKTSLQEIVATKTQEPVHYISQGSGPAHERHYVSWAIVQHEVIGKGEGSAKKIAEQVAAQQAYLVLAENGPKPENPPSVAELKSQKL